MSIVVSVRDIVNEMAEAGDDRTAFLNRTTGELVALSDEERRRIEDGFPAEMLPDHERALAEAARSGNLLELPSRFEHQEYSIVERFCRSIREPAPRKQLLDAIGGRHAFHDFNERVVRLGLVERWLHFRDEAFEGIAVRWLEKHGITYSRAA